MLVEQISVFIENKKGRLSEIADTVAAAGIDISALSLADTDEYGVLRMIVSDPHRTKEVLRESGVVGKVTKVLAIAIEDKPGGFASTLHRLTDAGIEVRYMYAGVSHQKGKAIMIVSVEDPEKAEAVLADSGMGAINPNDIYRD